MVRFVADVSRAIALARCWQSPLLRGGVLVRTRVGDGVDLDTGTVARLRLEPREVQAHATRQWRASERRHNPHVNAVISVV
jgi:hypothetical protein